MANKGDLGAILETDSGSKGFISAGSIVNNTIQELDTKEKFNVAVVEVLTSPANSDTQQTLDTLKQRWVNAARYDIVDKLRQSLNEISGSVFSEDISMQVLQKHGYSEPAALEAIQSAQGKATDYLVANAGFNSAVDQAIINGREARLNADTLMQQMDDMLFKPSEQSYKVLLGSINNLENSSRTVSHPHENALDVAVRDILHRDAGHPSAAAPRFGTSIEILEDFGLQSEMARLKESAAKVVAHDREAMSAHSEITSIKADPQNPSNVAISLNTKAEHGSGVVQLLSGSRVDDINTPVSERQFFNEVTSPKTHTISLPTSEQQQMFRVRTTPASEASAFGLFESSQDMEEAIKRVEAREASLASPAARQEKPSASLHTDPAMQKALEQARDSISREGISGGDTPEGARVIANISANANAKKPAEREAGLSS